MIGASDDTDGQRDSIGESQITVGRAPTSVLAFAPSDTRASAHHAEITYDGSGYILRDTGSTNGTRTGDRTRSTTSGVSCATMVT